MKNKERSNGRRAFSPVIAAIILSAVVIAIGGAIWSFSQGAMTIIAEDYAESVINMTDTISERFIVEHVAYSESGQKLRVWIFNYGNVDIEVKIEAGSVTHPQDPKEWIKMTAGGFELVELLNYDADSGDELIIRAYTRRENNVYYKYLVPIVP